MRVIYICLLWTVVLEMICVILFSTNRLNGLENCDGKQFNLHWSGDCQYANSYRDPYHGCNKDFLVIAHCGNGQFVAYMIGTSGAYGKHFSLACQFGQSCKVNTVFGNFKDLTYPSPHAYNTLITLTLL